MTDFGGAVKQSEEYNIAIIGIPFDEKSCCLRGALKGSQAIRAVSTGKDIKPWTELGANLKEEIVLRDLGDIYVSRDFLDVFSRVEEIILKILEKKAMPVVMGGIVILNRLRSEEES